MRLEEQKIGYLLDKWRMLGPPALPPAMLKWERVLSELMRRQQRAEAAQVLGQAELQGQTIPAELVEEIQRKRRQ
jgi:hypothetical protein